MTDKDKKEKVPDTTLRNTSDISLAIECERHFKQQYGGQEPLYTNGCWWAYNAITGAWEEVLQERLMEGIVQRLHGQPVLDVEGQAKPFWLSVAKTRNVLEYMRVRLCDPGFFVDDLRPRVGFRGGCVYLHKSSQEMLWEGLSPHNRLRYVYDFSWRDTLNAEAPQWQSFLDDILPDRRVQAIVQQYAGACMIGQGFRQKKTLLLYGASGDNGKSTLIDILEKAYPPGTVAHISPHSLGQDNFRAACLDGCLINLCDETPDADMRESDAWKTIVAGGAMTVRRPYGQPFALRSVAGHIYCANERPGTGDHSGGYWLRQVIVPFEQSIPKDRQDPELADRIVAEELPGVVLWLVRGAEASVRAKYKLPVDDIPDLVSAKEEWQATADSIRLWSTEEMDYDPETEARSWRPLKELYPLYSDWCRGRGQRPVGYARFRNRLESAGLVVKRTRGKSWCCALYEVSGATPKSAWP